MSSHVFINSSGCHECEIFGGGLTSYEGARAWRLCKKNPGHQSSIPYPEFRHDHLPDGFQTHKLFKCVKLMADHTVRLRVTYTSAARPDGYPFCNHRGTNILHTGSGFCKPDSMERSPVELRHKRYPGHSCPGCVQNSGNPSFKDEECCDYEILVATAQHVVYNTEEAKATQVDFFFDDEASEFNGKMKTIYGNDVYITNKEKDICWLRCITHDKALYERLSSIPRPCATWAKERNTSVIVSHPRGRPKQITVGEATRKDFQSVVGPTPRAPVQAVVVPR